jgi:hypothetical protein
MTKVLSIELDELGRVRLSLTSELLESTSRELHAVPLMPHVAKHHVERNNVAVARPPRS